MNLSLSMNYTLHYKLDLCDVRRGILKSLVIVDRRFQAIIEEKKKDVDKVNNRCQFAQQLNMY